MLLLYVLAFILWVSSQAIKEYSQWPTIPQVLTALIRHRLSCYLTNETYQLYIGSEFVGGSDIVLEMFNNGDLKNTLLRAGARFMV